MRKSIAVFKYDRNPACDPDFHITRHEADNRVNKHYATYIAPKAIQLRPPVTWTQDESRLMVSNLIKEAWKPRWSANYIVLQMEKTDTPSR